MTKAGDIGGRAWRSGIAGRTVESAKEPSWIATARQSAGGSVRATRAREGESRRAPRSSSSSLLANSPVVSLHSSPRRWIWIELD